MAADQDPAPDPFPSEGPEGRHILEPVRAEDQRVGPPAPHVVETEVEGEVSLYDPRREEVAFLNETASRIWRLADGTRTLKELIEELAGTYGISPDEIRPQVTETVRGLVDQGLLSPGPPKGPP